jgi:hypothetical protein
MSSLGKGWENNDYVACGNNPGSNQIINPSC